MNTKINLKVQGVRGGDSKWDENKGCIGVYIEGKQNGSITVDAFEGQAETYKRREQPNVSIFHGGKLVFDSSFSDLIEKLNHKEQQPINFLFGGDAVRVLNEEGINELVNQIEDDDLAYALFTYQGDVFELLAEFDGWDNYAALTDDQYLTLCEL